MRYHLHRLHAIFALSLALAAVVAAPATAMFERPSATALRPLTAPSIVHVAAHGAGFAWGDAAIGAGAAIAVMIIIVGGAGAAKARRVSRVIGSGAAVAG